MKPRLRLFLPFNLMSLMLVLIISLTTYSTSSATHVMGLDITYQHVDSMKYTFTLKFYRSCQGVAFNNPEKATFVRCATSGKTEKVSLSLVGIQSISPFCSSSSDPCKPANKYGTGEGIELHEYTTTIDFAKAPYDSMIKAGCCSIIFESGQCCRNGSITTGAANKNFYSYAMLDLCKAPGNSSPSFSSKPIGFLCCNQPVYDNIGAMDTIDFDSLSYAFACPLSAWNTVLSYSSGYSCSKPFTVYDPSGTGYTNPNSNPPTGLYLGSKTGQVVFTPTSCSDITVAVLEVREWRKDTSGKYQLIGITRRDLTYIISSCSGNNPPMINGPYSYNVCEGKQLCFNVTAYDKVKVPPPPQSTPPADTVRISWNSGIPGASFTLSSDTVLHQSGRFCWTPPVGTARNLPYNFNIEARDNACPRNTITNVPFSILVKPQAEAKIIIDTLSCGKYEVSSVLDSSQFEFPAKYLWSVLDTFGNMLSDTTLHFVETESFLSTYKRDTIQFRKGGTYIIKLRIDNSAKCPSIQYDTIVVPSVLEVALASGLDTFSCLGRTLRLEPVVTNNQSSVSYKWRSGNTNSFLDVQLNDTVKMINVRVDVTEAKGCTAWDSITVLNRPNPYVEAGNNLRTCPFDEVYISLSDSLARWDDPRDNDTNYVQQGDTLLKEWWHNKNLVSNQTLAEINLEGWYVAKVTDNFGCFSLDSLRLNVNDSIMPTLGPNRESCMNELVSIAATGFDTSGANKVGSMRWYELNNGSANTYLGNTDPLQFKITDDISILLEVTITEFGRTCKAVDTVSYTVNPLPIIQIPVKKELCCDSNSINLNTEDVISFGGKWFCSSNPSVIKDDSVFLPSKACGASSTTNWITYQYEDTNTHCMSRDSFKIVVNPLPVVKALGGTFCQSKGIVNLKKDKILVQPASLGLGRLAVNCLDCGTFDWSKILGDNGSGQPGAPQDFYLKVDSVTIPFSGNATSFQIEIKYTNAFGCSNRDTARIVLYRDLKGATIDHASFKVHSNKEPYEFCATTSPIQLKVTPDFGTWTNAYNTIEGTFFDPSKSTLYDAPFTLKYGYNIGGTCIGQDSVEVYLHSAPSLSIMNDTNITWTSASMKLSVWAKYQKSSGLVWRSTPMGSFNNSGSTTPLFTFNADPNTLTVYELSASTLKNNVCDSITKTVKINVYPSPCPTITSTHDTTKKILQLSTSNSKLVSYRWILNDSVKYGPSASFDLSLITSKKVQVQLTAFNALGDSCNQEIDVDLNSVGIEQIESYVKIYPNPVNDGFYLDLPVDYSTARYQITLLNGQLVQEQKLVGNYVNCKDLPNGTYVIRIRNGQSGFVGRFVKIGD
ncbi:MAG: hypothetical protein ACI83I_000694 [Bacteroidia bacterium]|jgi:hypothetical protein